MTAAELVFLLTSIWRVIYLASRWIGERDDVPVGDGLFFAVRSTVVLSLYDAFKPLADARLASPQST